MEVSELKKASTISLNPILMDLKLQIDKQLDFSISDFKINGKAHHLAVENLYSATDGLFLRTLFRGTIRVKN